MDLENGVYVVAAGNTEIWAINPNSRQKLRLSRDKSQILDLHASNAGIYYAAELRKKECKRVYGLNKSFDVNYVQIVDSISGNVCLTLTPPGTESLPLEKRLVELNFLFDQIDDSLLYVLNGSSGVVFPRCNGEKIQSGRMAFNGNDLFFDERKIASIDESVRYAAEVSANQLSRQFRIKNRDRYLRNRDFFR